MFTLTALPELPPPAKLPIDPITRLPAGIIILRPSSAYTFLSTIAVTGTPSAPDIIVLANTAGIGLSANIISLMSTRHDDNFLDTPSQCVS